MTAIEELAKRAKAAAAVLRTVSPASRADALKRMAAKLVECKDQVLAANAADMKEATHLSAAFQKRLKVPPRSSEAARCPSSPPSSGACGCRFY